MLGYKVKCDICLFFTNVSISISLLMSTLYEKVLILKHQVLKNAMRVNIETCLICLTGLRCSILSICGKMSVSLQYKTVKLWLLSFSQHIVLHRHIDNNGKQIYSHGIHFSSITQHIYTLCTLHVSTPSKSDNLNQLRIQM